MHIHRKRTKFLRRRACHFEWLVGWGGICLGSSFELDMIYEACRKHINLQSWLLTVAVQILNDSSHGFGFGIWILEEAM